VHKTTDAHIADGSQVDSNQINTRGDVAVGATSTETVTSVSVGGSFSGSAAVRVNAPVSGFTITTDPSIGSRVAHSTNVDADGNVLVSANDMLKLNVVGGNISASGTAAVGAAAAVPIVTKETHSFIGDGAHVNAKGGGAGATVSTGAFNVTP